MSLKSSILFIIIAGLLISCDKKRVFDEYESVGSAWNMKKEVVFELPKMDTLKKYNLFINLRANDDYKFNNLFLIVSMEQPNGLTKVDTLEYEMTDAAGNWLGTGFTELKENKLFYKENVLFSEKGDYKFNIKHATRSINDVKGENPLSGITDVGLSIEIVK